MRGSSGTRGREPSWKADAIIQVGNNAGLDRVAAVERSGCDAAAEAWVQETDK